MAGSSCGAVNAPMGPVSTMKGLRGGNDVRLQLEDFRRRLRANARDAHRASRGVVVLERLQLHGVHVGGGEHLAGGGIDLVEVGRADEALEHRDVRAVRRIQGEALRVRP